ncbi:MAG: helix-turn-helix domain-containing protein [Candidatus Bathyarchaeia archaeon]
MSTNDIVSTLQSFGLTRMQVQIFIYLTKMGPSSVSTLSNALRTNRMNIYRNLKKMQNMGLVNVIPGKPIKFSAVSASTALETLLSAARSKVLEMENKYTQILEELSRVSSQQEEHTIETRFRIHCGRRNVYSVMMQMLEKSEREVCLLTTPTDLIRMTFYGFNDLLKKLSVRGVKIKILTNITDKRVALGLKDYIRYATLRHSDMDIKAQFLIIDEKVAFTSLSFDDATDLDSESDSGFWTDSPHYVQSIKAFFEISWHGAQDASIVIWHLRAGKPMEKIKVFNSINEYHEYFIDIISRAEKEVLVCVTNMKEPFISESFIKALRDACARGVKVRILTIINEEESSLRNLLEVADVRHICVWHIHIDFVSTDTDESLFCLPISFIDKSKFQMLYLWSNSIILSKISKELFMDLWYRSLSSSIKLMEIRFRKAIKNLSEILRPLAAERGLLLNMPATIRGESGLNQNFDIALIIRDSGRVLAVGDILPEESDVKMALISLYVKAIDVGANQKLLVVPSNEWLSSDESSIAAAYNIELIEGLRAEDISRKIIEKIASKSQESGAS